MEIIRKHTRRFKPPTIRTESKRLHVRKLSPIDRVLNPSSPKRKVNFVKENCELAYKVPDLRHVRLRVNPILRQQSSL